MVIFEGEHCFHDYLNEKFVDYIIAKGGYIVTAGWLHHWQRHLAKAGFDQKQPQIFIRVLQ